MADNDDDDDVDDDDTDADAGSCITYDVREVLWLSG